jgi:hypothetical protein
MVNKWCMTACLCLSLFAGYCLAQEDNITAEGYGLGANDDGFCTRIDGYKMKSGTGSVSVSSVNGTKISLTIRAM